MWTAMELTMLWLVFLSISTVFMLLINFISLFKDIVINVLKAGSRG